jgi:hypothetical protein
LNLPTDLLRLRYLFGCGDHIGRRRVYIGDLLLNRLATDWSDFELRPLRFLAKCRIVHRVIKRVTKCQKRRPWLAGWLGRQDSNLEMTFQKTPFERSREFPLISEHIGTRDFSRVRC